MVCERLLDTWVVSRAVQHLTAKEGVDHTQPPKHTHTVCALTQGFIKVFGMGERGRGG